MQRSARQKCTFWDTTRREGRCNGQRLYAEQRWGISVGSAVSSISDRRQTTFRTYFDHDKRSDVQDVNTVGS